MKKYQVRTKDRREKTYGIWNNDMCAFQYIEAFNGLETVDIEKAIEECEKRNNFWELLNA